jgi:hypothetical protein
MGEAWRKSERGKECIKYCDLKSEGKRPLGRTRRRWEDYSTMNLREI